MLMNNADVYANLSATTLRKASGQKSPFSGPPLHRFDLSAASRNFSIPKRSL